MRREEKEMMNIIWQGKISEIMEMLEIHFRYSSWDVKKTKVWQMMTYDVSTSI